MAARAAGDDGAAARQCNGGADIRPQGSLALAEELKANTALVTLDLISNPYMGNAGAMPE